MTEESGSRRSVKDLLKELLGAASVKFTFSVNCISGLVGDCGCWRCRKERGEVVTLETEKAAEIRSKAERKLFRERTKKFLSSRRRTMKP